MRRQPHYRVTNQKCREIIEAIVKRCDSAGDASGSPAVGFAPDWGGNSLTVLIDGGHTHVGDPDFPFWIMVEDLHDMLIKGAGLSVHHEEATDASQSRPRETESEAAG